MAKSKIPAIKDLNGYFFMGIRGNHVELVYHDDTDQGLAIGAGLTSLMEEDTKLFDIFSAAFITAMQSKESKSNWEKVKIPQKEKSISKTAKKPVKTATKSVKKK